MRYVANGLAVSCSAETFFWAEGVGMDSNAYGFTLGFSYFAAPYLALFAPFSDKLSQLCSILRNEIVDSKENRPQQFLDNFAIELRTIREQMDLDDYVRIPYEPPKRNVYRKGGSTLAGQRKNSLPDLPIVQEEKKRDKLLKKIRRRKRTERDPYADNDVIEFLDDTRSDFLYSLTPRNYRRNTFYLLGCSLGQCLRILEQPTVSDVELRIRPIPPKCILDFCTKVEATIGHPRKNIELLYTRSINQNDYIDSIWILFKTMLKHIRERSTQPLTNGSSRDVVSEPPGDVDSAITKLKDECSKSGTTILNVAHFLLVNDDLPNDAQAEKIGDIIRKKYPNCKINDSSAWSKVKSALEKCGFEFIKKQPEHTRSTYKLVNIPEIWKQAAEKIIQDSPPPVTRQPFR